MLLATISAAAWSSSTASATLRITSRALPSRFNELWAQEGPSSPEQREALVRVEQIRLDVVDDFGVAAERGHRAGEADPVQELLLARILDLRGGQLAPAREIARGELIEARPVAVDIGIDPVMLRGQERMRPARRRDERDAPRAVGEDARNRGADIEAARRVGSGRIDRVGVGAAGQMRAAAAFGDDRGAVAIDVKRHHRIGETLPVVIEIEDRVDESVRQAELVAHLIGVADVEIGLEQLCGKIATSGAVPLDVQDRIGRLPPDIAELGAPGAREGSRVDRIEREDAERRNAVLMEIL